MRRTLFLVAVWGAAACAQPLTREVVYGGAVTLGGQIVPSYDKGFLMYLHEPIRLQVFRPDTQLAFDLELPCPGTGHCSATAVAADGRDRIAVGFSYFGEKGRTAGIRMLDLKGRPLRFIDTSRHVPGNLCFDRNGDLWSLGWERDPLIDDTENKDNYNLVRKYSAEGRLLGEYVPRSLWPGKLSAPGVGARGYWRMAAASDRVGVIIHEAFAGNRPEWVEWDLTGKLLSRTRLPGQLELGRAFTANGRLYALFFTDSRELTLRVLETGTTTWTAVPDNLPDPIRTQGVFLLGADGDELVYRVMGGGNVRLVWARPEAS
jgi:hypothetical protein